VEAGIEYERGGVGKMRREEYARVCIARVVGRSGSEFMTPTGKSGFRKKNIVETRMIADYAFNHAGTSQFFSQKRISAGYARGNYRMLAATQWLIIA
jgi:hypothetical protein